MTTMKVPPKRFTKEFEAEAVRLALSNGCPRRTNCAASPESRSDQQVIGGAHLSGGLRLWPISLTALPRNSQSQRTKTALPPN
jgi:hypothetical protein